MFKHEIPNYSRYYMDDDCNVYSKKTKSKLTSYKNDTCYNLKEDNSKNNKLISKDELSKIVFGYIRVKDNRNEILKPIKGFSNYLFSSKGRIFCIIKKKFLDPYCNYRSSNGLFIAYKITDDTEQIVTITARRIVNLVKNVK